MSIRLHASDNDNPPGFKERVGPGLHMDGISYHIIGHVKVFRLLHTRYSISIICNSNLKYFNI